MKDNELTAEQYEQMIQDLENGVFVPVANEGAYQPLYYPFYNNWEEMLEADESARDAISSQYYSFINK